MEEDRSATWISDRRVSRRTVLAAGAGAALAPMLGTVTGVEAAVTGRPASGGSASFDLMEASIDQMARALRSRAISSTELTAAYLSRIAQIDKAGPAINSIIELNPDALAIAALMDRERAAGHSRGPLHGVPVLIKDNIDTGDRMQTTAGSWALYGHPAPWDATVARKLRQAGAIILGKTNLSEWANFRSLHSTSGWSGRGGQTRNPYVLDRNPSGSSSGSASAVSANLAAAALGSETDGSIVSPSSVCGVVGLKPTLGLTSRMGVVPIAHSQDVVGPIGRTVWDVAAVLSAIAGYDPHDPATRGSIGRRRQDYTRFVNPNGLRGARLGVVRAVFGSSLKADLIVEHAIHEMRRAGAHVKDVTIPSYKTFSSAPDEFTVLLYEFKADIAKYLRNRGNTVGPKSLADLIRFNRNHRPQELKWFDQSIFLMAQQKGPLTDPAYQKALANDLTASRTQGIDAAMNANNLDALVAPTNNPAWPTDLVNADHFLFGSSSYAAVAGYPDITVPAGFSFGLPVGVSFFGRAYSEPTLIRIASGFEAVSRHRRPPQFLTTLPYHV